MNAPNSDDPAALLALARVLLGLGFDRGIVLIAGRVPDNFPRDLIPPAPVVTVGGMDVGEKTSAVFRYPPSTVAPIAEYRALLEASGWKAGNALGGGFDNTRMVMLCRDTSLATVAWAGDARDATILVSISPCDDWPCRAGARFPDHGTIKIPRLASPPGVEWNSGGQCGGGDHTTHNIRVTSSLAPTELLPVYAQQLADAGWQIGAIQTTPTSALQWLEASDQRGRVWRGMLAIYENGPARDVFIYVATGELLPTRGSPRAAMPNAP